MLAGFGEAYGLSQPQAIALGRPLGGGMGMAQVCGAVSGALMILGLAQEADPQGEAATRQRVQTRARQLREEFSRRRGSALCRDILGVDISTPEGRGQAVEQGLFVKVCPGVVAEAARLLEEMLARPAQPPADPARSQVV